MTAKALPYERATSGDKAIAEMQKLLRAFGCTKFGSLTDDSAGTLLVQFEYRGRQVSVQASMKGYAAAYLRLHKPAGYTSSGQDKAREAKALAIGRVAVYSILRDWIKGQIMAIETGVLSFEGAFLGQILLGSGKTVLEHVVAADVLRLESVAA